MLQLGLASSPPGLDPLHAAWAGISRDSLPGRGREKALQTSYPLKLVERIIARRPDMRLLTAINGTSGIEVARGSQPDVILMDINLPDITGIEALTILRSDPLTAHIPIVALSANAMPRDIEKGMKAGFFRYITKPIKINEFMDALDLAFECADNRAAKRR
jgi:CheY-like chemotaxis protein